MPDEDAVAGESSATKHEPHLHAHRRVLTGVAAVAVVALGWLVWARYGAAIMEHCNGQESGCPVPRDDVVPPFGTASGQSID